MTADTTVPVTPRFRHRDALAATALDALGEAVAVVDDSAIVLATAPFRRKTGDDDALPPVAEKLIAAGGGMDDGGPDGTRARSTAAT